MIKKINIYFSNIYETLNSKLFYEFNPRIKCNEDEEKLVIGSWGETLDKCNCEGIIQDKKCSSENGTC